MKVSVQTTPYAIRFGHEKGLSMLKNAGFEAVDFGIGDYADWHYITGGEGTSIFDKPDAEVIAFFRQIGDYAASIGLEIGQTHSPFPTSTWAHDTEVTERFARLARLGIQATAAMGCGYTVVHPAFFVDDYVYDECLERRQYTRRLNDSLYIPLIPYLKEYNVKLCVENMWAYYPGTKFIAPCVCSHSAEMIDYIDGYNEIAGQECFCACLDTGHAYLTGDDIPAFIKALGSRLQRVHMHDVIKNEDLHQAPYIGNVDWDELTAALRENKFAGPLNFETGSFSCKRPPELTESAAKTMFELADHLRKKVTG